MSHEASLSAASGARWPPCPPSPLRRARQSLAGDPDLRLAIVHFDVHIVERLEERFELWPVHLREIVVDLREIEIDAAAFHPERGLLAGEGRDDGAEAHAAFHDRDRDANVHVF